MLGGRAPPARWSGRRSRSQCRIARGRRSQGHARAPMAAAAAAVATAARAGLAAAHCQAEALERERRASPCCPVTASTWATGSRSTTSANGKAGKWSHA
eukprot:6174202-Pleurochrysis_carterae.AAC.2